MLTQRLLHVRTELLLLSQLLVRFVTDLLLFRRLSAPLKIL